MNKLQKITIILGVILVYILVVSLGYFEPMDNLQASKKQVVTNDLNLSLLAKYFNPDKFEIQSLSEWKKNLKPFDIFINWGKINIGNIEQELRQIDSLSAHAKPQGKIINITEDKSNKLGNYILVKYLEELSDKYYVDSIGFCNINLDVPFDSETIEFIVDTKWNVLTSRVFSNKLIKTKFSGYLLGLTELYGKTNLLIDQVAKNKFNGETVIIPDIEPKELSVYSNNSGLLANKLAEIHNVKPEQIQFHNGIMGFLQLMVPVFVPEAHDIICWQMDYLTRIAKGRNVIHVESIIKNSNATPNYEQILSKLSSKTRMIYISGPIGKTAFDEFLKAVPENILVLIDFCYNGFSNDKTHLEMFDCVQYKNYVIGINTFSKSNGLAGVHLSYSIGHEHIQTIISNYFHYPVNLFYENLAVKALEPNYTNRVKSYYKTQADKMSKVLEENKIPYWFELVVTLVVDISKLSKDKIIENLNKNGLDNYWKISGNHIKIFLSTDQNNTQLINSIIT